MDFDDDSPDEDGPVPPLLPPDDRLWRHPSEIEMLGGTRRAGGRSRPRLSDVRALPLVLAGLVGALLATGLVTASDGFGGGPAVVREVEQSPVPVAGSLTANPNIVAIAERVKPAIVRIEVDGTQGEGSGSGVMFRSDGLILTNHHVVEGASDIRVTLSGNRELEAQLLGGDPDTDIAVIKVDGADFPVATLGSATKLKVGQPAVAIGSPLGLAGGPSVTAGVVSALGRQVEGQVGPPLLDMIQTDAPIAPGSSGGALLDAAGAVIGITTAIAVSDVGAEGLGFATPIDIARDVADQLVRTGKVAHVWLGVEGEDIDAATAKELGVPGGALVKKVWPDSPASRAGVRDGDAVTAVDGQPIESMVALIVALRARRPGEAVRLRVVRDKSGHTMNVELAERPKSLGR